MCVSLSVQGLGVCPGCAGNSPDPSQPSPSSNPLGMEWENDGRREHLPRVNAWRDTVCSAASAPEQREVTAYLLMANVTRNYVESKAR